ncbi:unnamed protein product [Acanthosepion pharaonis]|uniref:Uncharacterized protein n=1 Tax=Acanthosepion pharaonis TaxID=158019 RepID=A0A812DME4_ACAPH|nr:unnamed protein product [Sepia pharaonis]
MVAVTTVPRAGLLKGHAPGIGDIGTLGGGLQRSAALTSSSVTTASHLTVAPARRLHHPMRALGIDHIDPLDILHDAGQIGKSRATGHKSSPAGRRIVVAQAVRLWPRSSIASCVAIRTAAPDPSPWLTAHRQRVDRRCRHRALLALDPTAILMRVNDADHHMLHPDDEWPVKGATTLTAARPTLRASCLGSGIVIERVDQIRSPGAPRGLEASG